MSMRGFSQAGSSGQLPTSANHVMRSNTKVQMNSQSNSKARCESPNEKKGKAAAAGEQARQVLTESICAGIGEQVMPILLFKTFKKILEKYDSKIPEDLHLTLQAYAILLQEGANIQHLMNKAIEVVPTRVEEKMEAGMMKSINTMSGFVENITAYQKELQATSNIPMGLVETLQKLTGDIGKSVKEATEASDQLSSTVTMYKEVLTKSLPVRQAPTVLQGNNAEDPRLARDVDRKQRQILIELSKEYTEGKSVTFEGNILLDLS